jgi:GntR family transcriptional regulator/MocR family aminotransferase
MDYQLLISRYSNPSEQVGWSAQRRLHACLRKAIQHGSLPAGSRLLSSRVLAHELGIARNTVVYAYEQLVAEGFLHTDRRGSVVMKLADMQNSFISKELRSDHGAGLAKRALGIMPLPVAADLCGGFAPGVPALAHFPVSLWRRLSDRTWRSIDTAHLGYANAAGEMVLRCAIADHLRASRGVDCDASQVFITDGTQSSLDLCAHAFADVGDKVWLENPGYVGAHSAFRAAQLKVIGIKVDDDGIAPTSRDWLTQVPKLIYVTPSHQYPTGSVLGLARRIDLIKQAALAGALIIEDDYDSEFRHDGPPIAAMQGLVENAPVLYLGTFSKSLFPALRIAYIVVPKNLIAALASLVGKSTLRGRSADQLTLASFLREGHFSLHLRRMRRLYQKRRDVLVAALDDALGDLVSIHGHSAGMHLAVRFRDTETFALLDEKISAQALEQGIVVPALSAHLVGKRQHGWCGLMLGYAQVPEEQIPSLVNKLAKIIRESLT